MTRYFRPLLQNGAMRPAGAILMGGGPLWFSHVEILSRQMPPRIQTAEALPDEVIERLSAARTDLAGLDLSRPVLMGILNTTPDSFSDAGQNGDCETAVASALEMFAAGADVVDVGGESTRPGAEAVPPALEIDRTRPVIAALRRHTQAPISIDTRKAPVAAAALGAGADLINDVSGFRFDPDLAPLAASAGCAVCVMHMQGEPATMQDDPRYEDVLFDVYDALADRIAALERIGIARENMIVDPGIGFGKSEAHNLRLLQNLSLFHGLGVPLLLGVSRKGFIGRIGGAANARARAPGSIAVGLAALAQGVHILRVHDVAETAQAIRLWRAVR